MDTKDIKKDFPIFKTHPNLVYLDSTATALKPQSVIKKVEEYYKDYSANVHRGIYQIAERATAEYEKSREVIAQFINANRTEEIVYTRGTTEAINLVAYSLGREIISEGDEIVTTVMEHHSNFVPWQQLAIENGAVFKVIDVNEDGYLAIDVNKLHSIISKKTKILALVYVSNVLGTINPVKEIIRAAKKINPQLIVIIDAAQAVPHMQIDVQDLGCDLLAFSSHKMLGPTGIGILWGKYELLNSMFPFQFGGEMISSVSIEQTTFNTVPHKFEAGTPHISGAVALKEAVYYLQKIGLDEVRKHETELVAYALKTLYEEFGKDIRIIGPQNIHDRGGIVAFSLSGAHAHDVAQILDEDHIAVRAGNHCAMPLHTRYNLTATARASFYVYNEKEDIEKLVEGLKKIQRMFAK